MEETAGYEQSRILNPDKLRMSIMGCSYCKKVMNNPVQCSECRKHFCYKCLSSYQTKTGKCPYSNKNITKENYVVAES